MWGYHIRSFLTLSVIAAISSGETSWLLVSGRSETDILFACGPVEEFRCWEEE